MLSLNNTESHSLQSEFEKIQTEAAKQSIQSVGELFDLALAEIDRLMERVRPERDSLEIEIDGHKVYSRVSGERPSRAAKGIVTEAIASPSENLGHKVTIRSKDRDLYVVARDGAVLIDELGLKKIDLLQVVESIGEPSPAAVKKTTRKKTPDNPAPGKTNEKVEKTPAAVEKTTRKKTAGNPVPAEMNGKSEKTPAAAEKTIPPREETANNPAPAEMNGKVEKPPVATETTTRKKTADNPAPGETNEKVVKTPTVTETTTREETAENSAPAEMNGKVEKPPVAAEKTTPPREESGDNFSYRSVLSPIFDEMEEDTPLEKGDVMENARHDGREVTVAKIVPAPPVVGREARGPTEWFLDRIPVSPDARIEVLRDGKPIYRDDPADRAGDIPFTDGNRARVERTLEKPKEADGNLKIVVNSELIFHVDRAGRVREDRHGIAAGLDRYEDEPRATRETTTSTVTIEDLHAAIAKNNELLEKVLEKLDERSRQIERVKDLPLSGVIPSLKNGFNYMGGRLREIGDGVREKWRSFNENRERRRLDGNLIQNLDRALDTYGKRDGGGNITFEGNSFILRRASGGGLSILRKEDRSTIVEAGVFTDSATPADRDRIVESATKVKGLVPGEVPDAARAPAGRLKR